MKIKQIENYILKELDMLKMFKSPLTCGAREIIIIRSLLYYLSIFPVGI
jgi:hypothetical protein